MTVIDELIVKLGLDSTKFDKGKEKVNKDLKDTGKNAEQTGDKFKGLAQAAGAFLAVIGGSMAIRSFIEHTINANASLDRLSKNLNVNANEVSAWSNAVEQAGGSASGLQGTMAMLSKSQTELMLTGQSGLIPFFSALGLSMTDAYGKALPVTDLLTNMGQALLDKTPNRETANNMGLMMGIDQGTLNLILKGRQEIEMTIKRQKEYGAVTKKQAEESSRLQKAMIESKQTFAAFGRELLSSALPVIEKLVKMFADFGNWIKDNQEFVKIFLSILAVGLGAVAAATIPINLAAVAVVGLAAAIAGLKQDYDAWKQGADSLIDWKKWEPGIQKAGYAIRWIKDLLGDVIYRAIAAADMIGSLATGNFKQAKAAFAEFKKGNGSTYGKEETPAVMSSPAAGGKTMTMGDRSQETIAYFRSQGWTAEQAAGIAANIQRESNFNHRAVGDNGQAYGLAQWQPDRQANFAKLFGKPIRESTFEEQLAFIQHELTKGGEQRAGNMLRGSTSARSAGAIISTKYERPEYTAREASLRGALAQSYMGGIPGAANVARNTDAAASMPSGGNNTKIDTHIGEIKVYSAATDAAGITKDIGKLMEGLFTNQWNYGLF
jgi:hypothetical protein